MLSPIQATSPDSPDLGFMAAVEGTPNEGGGCSEMPSAVTALPEQGSSCTIEGPFVPPLQV